MEFEAPDYSEALRDCVSGYRGAYERSVLRCPEVFELFARLFVHPDLPPGCKPLVNSVLAYFVAPQDVMPEESMGPYGLLDDLFLAAHTFRLLRRELPGSDLLSRCWTGRGEVEQVMDEIFSESRAAVGKHRKEIMRMAGLGR